VAAAAAFYGPALAATHGDWPAPLDDVFIHYDFARSTARLHPFEWIAGQGYSSGETSPLYAGLLAAGYAAGFRGLNLGAWAAALACASLMVMMRALRELVSPAPAWVSCLGAAMLVDVGVLDWTWFSGMEGAVFCAALAILLVRAKRAREAPPTWRRRRQYEVGLCGAALVLLRPEAAVLVVLVAVVVARRALSQSATLAFARCAGPATLAGLAVVLANFVGTGEGVSAGAIAKLLSYRPFLTDIERSKAFVVSLAHAALLLESQLGRGTGLALLLPSLCIPAILARRTRALAAVCVLGALGWALLVSWNDAARFQNFRYYMPALALVLFASTLGLAAVGRSRWLGPCGAGVAAAGIALAGSSVPEEIVFFREASENIHDQQVEVGRRLAARMPEHASVLVGDAGAIPYVSGRHAIDALGLGGYHGLPFARAALQGEAATVELIERIAPGERPGFMALYATWFSGITGAFGREVDHVSLEENVVCGASTKTLYEADWSALAQGPEGDVPPVGGGSSVVDALDVADVVSEGEHAYVSPAPLGGWTSLEVRLDGAGVRRFDGGRVIPEGQSESFTLRSGAGPDATIVVRTDEARPLVVARLSRRGALLTEASLVNDEGATAGRWSSARASLGQELRPGDRLVFHVARGTFRDFHVWVVTAGSTSASL
jgi:hypothetical protein